MILATQFRRDLVVALSVANITFARTWNELLTYTREQAYFFRELPSIRQSLAAAINVLVLWILFFGLIRLMRLISRKWGDGWALTLVPFLVLPAFNSLSGIISAVAPKFAPQGFLGSLHLPGKLGAMAILVLIIYVIRHWPDRILKTAAWLTLNLALLIPLEAGAIIWHAISDERDLYTAHHLASPLPDKPDAPPVLLLLIDELDYRLLFENRPAGLALPEFDRLRSEAFSAQRATPPGRATSISVPSLLTGKRITRSYTLGPEKLTVEPSNGGPLQTIHGEDTIFSSVRAVGVNTSVVGWYLPYCRTFGSVLSSCSWYDLGSRVNVEGNSFLRDLVAQAQAPFETATFSPFPQSVLGKHRIFNAAGIERDGTAALSTPSPGFVYIHHMATHAPYVYDRLTGTFTKKNSPISGYVDGLALADIVLGKFRKAMEAGGSWDRAVVLVTADHHFRASMQFDGKTDDRVPWIVKMHGVNNRINYHFPIHTIITRRFLEAAVRGDIRTQAEAAEWIRTQEGRVYAESEWK